MVVKKDAPSLWLKLIRWTFYLGLLILPFAFTLVNYELFEFNKMLLVYAWSILAGTFWTLDVLTTKKINFRPSFWHLLALIFLLSQMLSTLFSLDMRTSLFGYYSRFQGGLFSTLAELGLYFVFVSSFNAKEVRKILITLMLAAILAALYAFPEHFGHSFSCLVIHQSFDVSCWVQKVQERVFGTFGQPNWLAAYLIALLPLFWVKIFEFDLDNWRQLAKPTILKLSEYLVATMIMVATLIFTGSKSGFLGFAAALGIFLGLNFKRQAHFYLGSSILILTTLILMIGFGSPFNKPLISWSKNAPISTSTATPDEGGTPSGQIRAIVWQGAVKIWQRYPLLGSGVETFAYSYYLDRPVAHNYVSEWDFLYNKAHNEFLNFLATTGVVGFLAYLGLIAGTTFLALNLYHARKFSQVKIHATAILAGFAALNISNFFGFVTVNVAVLFFLFPAVLIVWQTPVKILKLTKNRYLAKIWSHRSVTLGLKIGVAFIATWLLIRVLSLWLADYNLAVANQKVKNGELVAALNNYNQAIMLSPGEPLFYDSLANTEAKLAVELVNSDQNNPELIQKVVDQALQNSDLALKLNPANLNFYKSRFSTLMLLAQIDPEQLENAKASLLAAQKLAPTDPKIPYFLGLVAQTQGNLAESRQDFIQALALKNDYTDAQKALNQQK